MSKRKYAWSWKDYERECAKDEARAKRTAERAAETNSVADTLNSRKGAASPKEAGCEGGAPEGTSRAATERMVVPANAPQARPFISRPTPSVHEAKANSSTPIAGVQPPADIERYRRALAVEADRRQTEREKHGGTLPIAPSREECPRCGIPGFKGCDHQLPYREPEGIELAYDYKRAGQE